MLNLSKMLYGDDFDVLRESYTAPISHNSYRSFPKRFELYAAKGFDEQYANTRKINESREDQGRQNQDRQKDQQKGQTDRDFQKSQEKVPQRDSMD